MEDKPSRDKRSPDLIANFVDGYAKDWKFTVIEAFRESLDIKWTPKVADKAEIFTWTQGKQFNFKQGQVIYDTPLAYKLQWNEALKHINLYIQITESFESGLLKFKLYRPIKDKSNVEIIDRFCCTQDEFVAFLKTGFLKTGNNYPRNLFSEYKIN
jgi:hypothetical protein